MSQVDTAHAWWSRLRHQGLLLSPVVMLERYASAPEQAHFSATGKLRDAYTRFVSTAEMRIAPSDPAAGPGERLPLFSATAFSSPHSGRCQASQARSTSP